MEKKFNLIPLVEKLLNNQSLLQLPLLTRYFSYLIPFNGPHAFKFIEVKDNVVKIEIPYKKNNLNHLRGIHAGAIATLGEFCAGIAIIKQTGFNRYRLILSSLKIDYSYQGKTKLTGSSSISATQVKEIESNLHKNGVAEIKLTTQVHDEQQNLVATIISFWQIKEWTQVNATI